MAKGEKERKDIRRLPWAEGLLVVTLATLAVMVGLPTTVPVQHTWSTPAPVVVCDTAPGWVYAEVRDALQAWRVRGAPLASLTRDACDPCDTEIRETDAAGRLLPGAPCRTGAVLVDGWRWGGEGWESNITSGYTVTERGAPGATLPRAFWSTIFIPDTEDEYLRTWLVTHELGHAAGLGHAVKGWNPDRSPVRAKYHVMAKTYDDFGAPWREGQIKPSAWEGVLFP